MRNTRNEKNEMFDDFALNYRVFELTSFDQILKDSPLTKRILSIDALNQNQINPPSFMKLFRTV